MSETRIGKPNKSYSRKSARIYAEGTDGQDDWRVSDVLLQEYIIEGKTREVAIGIRDALIEYISKGLKAKEPQRTLEQLQAIAATVAADLE